MNLTYAQFLLVFLCIPILLLALANRLSAGRGRRLPEALRNVSPGLAIFVHILVALAYTTPWDNYLVATGVWYYHPDLVAGVTLGWVPLEEYLFFILQTLLTGLWLVWLGRCISIDTAAAGAAKSMRSTSTLALFGIWLLSAGILAADWQPGRYLGLILVWAAPPIMLQTAFGADLLWQRRRLVLPALLAPTLYLGLADSLAIEGGTWTIATGQSLNLLILGRLPLEELIFFLVTNTLIAFGTTLLLLPESRTRSQEIFQRLGGLFQGTEGVDL